MKIETEEYIPVGQGGPRTIIHEMSIEEVAAIAVEVYDTGTTKPAMAGRLAGQTLISKRESVLLIETIDRYVDQHQEDWDGNGN